MKMVADAGIPGRRLGIRAAGRLALGLGLMFALVPGSPAEEAEFQMKTYQMVFLRKGPNAGAESPDAAKVQAAHLAYLAKLNQERVNLLYGPFLDDTDLRGIALLDVADADAAKKLFAEDAHVKAGNLAIEVKPWMGPKGWFHPPLDPMVPENLVFGFLMRGPNRSHPAAEAQEIQKQHLAYMDGLHKQGKLVMAGPFLDDSDWRGVVVYRVASLEEAKRLAGEDPAVKAGRLVIDARPWMTLKGILK